MITDQLVVYQSVNKACNLRSRKYTAKKAQVLRLIWPIHTAGIFCLQIEHRKNVIDWIGLDMHAQPNLSSLSSSF